MYLSAHLLERYISRSHLCVSSLCVHTQCPISDYHKLSTVLATVMDGRECATACVKDVAYVTEDKDEGGDEDEGRGGVQLRYKNNTERTLGTYSQKYSGMFGYRVLVHPSSHKIHDTAAGDGGGGI